MGGVAVVTGGSRGIGAATARLLASRGWAVCIDYREGAEAARKVVLACEAAGARASAVSGDVSSPEALESLFAAADSLGPVTALVNNAGIVDHPARVDEIYNGTSESDVRRERDRAVPVRAMTLGLAREVAAEGVRVNAVRPGLIDTDIHESGGQPGRIERLEDRIPMRRGGQPDEVANAIAWLCSPCGVVRDRCPARCQRRPLSNDAASLCPFATGRWHPGTGVAPKYTRHLHPHKEPP